MKVSPAFSKAAGSQGRALSRSPQRAESSLIFPSGKSTKINKRKRPSDRTVFSEIARPAGRAFLFLFSLIFPRGRSGKSKRISPVATGDLRLCLKTPQAFRERLERKLYFASGRESQSDADFTGTQNGLCAILINNHQIALIGQIHTGCGILSLWRADQDTLT